MSLCYALLLEFMISNPLLIFVKMPVCPQLTTFGHKHFSCFRIAISYFFSPCYTDTLNKYLSFGIVDLGLFLMPLRSSESLSVEIYHDLGSFLVALITIYLKLIFWLLSLCYVILYTKCIFGHNIGCWIGLDSLINKVLVFFFLS